MEDDGSCDAGSRIGTATNLSGAMSALTFTVSMHDSKAKVPLRVIRATRGWSFQHEHYTRIAELSL